MEREANDHYLSALARRLRVDAQGLAGRGPVGWVDVLLAHQRLVGASRVRRRRARSEVWQRADAARRAASAGVGGGVAGITLPSGTDGSALAGSGSDEDIDVVGGVAGGAPAAGVDGVVEVVMAVVDAPPTGPGETQEEEVPGPPSARLATQAQRRKRPQRLGVVEDVGPPPPRRRTRVAAGVDGAAP